MTQPTTSPAGAAPMQPRVTLITLAVADLELAVRFYRDGLGLPTAGIVGREHANGAVAFFELQPGLKLALWPRRSLAAEAGLPLDGPSATEMPPRCALPTTWPQRPRCRG